MNIIKEASRFLVGGLFIFSGLIKINDPVGTAIKLEEYFDVFANDFAPFFEYLVPAALFFSVLLSVLEVVLGIALFIGYRMRITAWVLLALIIFFTFLTFYSAVFNKVTDCGCFGDAIKLTPWQSFYKDIVLTILIVIIFIQKDRFKPIVNANLNHIVIGSSTLVLTILAIYAIGHLPFIDFRTYAIGNHLPSLMQPSAELKYSYIMEKDGETLVMEKYPTDPGYTFKEMKLLNPDAQPKITDLAIWNDEGDFTDQLFEGDRIIILIYDVTKSDQDAFPEINELIKSSNKAEAWILTASGYDEIEGLRHEHQLAIPYFYADATVLKTMARSNPAILLLSNGKVVGKWHYHDVPNAYEVNGILNQQ